MTSLGWTDATSRGVDLEALRYIGDGKSMPDRALPEHFAASDLIAIFRNMTLLRVFDERAVSLQRQGRIGTYPPFWGEEATQAGALHACRDEDWLFPSYRQNAIGILRGVPPSKIYRYRRGHGGEHGFWNPREHRVAPICIPIATHLPHAVGLSWAAKIKGEETASLVWFGDGATSEGDFHEALNFAAVQKVATVFFCTNNQWAISTPFHKQTATATVVEKAVAYGMPGIRVDGFDPVACWHATSDALLRARAGDGPTLIEAFCYRLGPHATADDPALYRDQRERERWLPLEPLARTAKYLQRTGMLSTNEIEDIWDGSKETIARAVAELDASTPPGPDVLFDDVYAGDKPWTLRYEDVDVTSPNRA